MLKGDEKRGIVNRCKDALIRVSPYWLISLILYLKNYLGKIRY